VIDPHNSKTRVRLHMDRTVTARDAGADKMALVLQGPHHRCDLIAAAGLSARPTNLISTARPWRRLGFLSRPFSAAQGGKATER
jgi:hypothetical protein